MPPSRTVPLPVEMADALNSEGRGVSTRLLMLALQEADKDRAPLLLPPGRRKLVSVLIKHSVVDTLQDVRNRHGIHSETSDGELLGRLAYTALRDGVAPESSAPVGGAGSVAPPLKLVEMLARLGQGGSRVTEARKEQLDLARILESADARGAVALVQASTGTGKGLVIAATAVARALEAGRCLISAPTHLINRQAIDHLTNDLPNSEATRAQIIYGRRQFFSPSALRDYLDDLRFAPSEAQLPVEQRDALAELLEAHLQNFHRGAREGVFLMEHVTRVAPGVPEREFELTQQIEDEASALYESQFDGARAARIVVCTHAMLAQEVIGRQREAYVQMRAIKKSDARAPGAGAESRATSIEADAALFAQVCGEGLLGRFDTIIVDEAHLLEEAIANAASDDISLYSLRGKMAAAGLKTPLALMERIYDTLSRMDGADREDRDQQARQVLERLQVALEMAVKAKKGLPDDDHAHFVRCVDAIRRALSSVGGRIYGIDYSPDRRYPRITIGPRSVSRELALLWARCRVGICLSATLYTSDMTGRPSGRYMAFRLAIPKSRLATFEPLRPPWVTQGVTLHAPSVARGHSKQHPWAPPDYAALTHELKESYFRATAAPLREAALSARGGTLVLCTSHEAVGAYKRILTEMGLGTRLVCSAPNKTLATILADYHEKYAEHGRPVWLAVGGAWTGLNIYHGLASGVPGAEDDLVLTDLCIPRLPLKAHGTTTDKHRAETSGSALEWINRLQQCVLMLEQGIGRLVRMPGRSGRNLWVFDPRAFDPSFAGATFTALWQRYQVKLLANPAELAVETTPKAPAAAPDERRRAFVVVRKKP